MFAKREGERKRERKFFIKKLMMTRRKGVFASENIYRVKTGANLF